MAQVEGWILGVPGFGRSGIRRLQYACVQFTLNVMAKTPKPTPAADPARKQAVIYARVSTKEQEKEGFSIPAQLKLLKEYAAAQGFTVVQEYVDRQADRPCRIRRDGQLFERASSDPRDAGGENRPALPQPQGLGDGG
jgi:hypothetical protein